MKLMVRIPVLLLSLVAFLGQEIASGQDSEKVVPAIDGVFDEWNESHVIATDLKPKSSDSLGVASVSAIAYGADLFVRLEFDQEINLQGGNPNEKSMRLQFKNEFIIDFDDRKIQNGSRSMTWADVDFEVLPTYASKVFEMKIRGWKDVAKKSTPRVFGLDVKDATAYKVKPVRAGSLTQRTYECPEKNEKGFRIASQNTLRGGLAEADRQDQFKRLLSMTNADIFCFQEEWNSDLFQTGVNAVLPDAKNTVWDNGCAIATKYKMTKLPMDLVRGCSALIEKDGENIVVICCHFKCCGYAGSDEDKLRISEAGKINEAIKKLRDGGFGAAAADAPVVLIGDYNLVGSRKPLDKLYESGLKDILLRARDGSACTWRGLNARESYWPGRLDLASVAGVDHAHGYIINTELMPDARRKKLGVEIDDSRASDHLTLVLDCYK